MSRLPQLTWAAVVISTLVACGSSASPAPSPTISAPHRASPPPPATPPPAPDVEQVQVVATGLAAYLETTQPVAIVRNLSHLKAATTVTASFSILTSKGAPVTATTDTIAILGPGQTTVMSPRVQLQGFGDHATATVTAAAFGSDLPMTITASPGRFACGTCGGPRGGFGEVTTTLTSTAPLAAGSAVFVGTACTTAGGAIVAAGSRRYVWPGGTSAPVTIPVLEDGAVAACQVGATPAG